MADTVREYFEEMQAKVDPERTRGQRASYRFDIEGAGSWHVAVDDGTIAVSESQADADCVIQASEQTFMKIVRGEQDPRTAYLFGKVKVKGDMGLAMRLRDLFA